MIHRNPSRGGRLSIGGAFFVSAVGCLGLVSASRGQDEQPAPSSAYDTAIERALAQYQAGDLGAAAAGFVDAAGKAETDDDRAAALNNGCVVYNDIGDYRASEGPCREAVNLRRRSSPDERLARALNNLAIAEQGLGQPQLAVESLDEALELNRGLGAWEGVVANLTNLGTNRRVLGQFGAAERAFQAAVELAATHATEPWSDERAAIAQLNHAGLLERVGRHREALELLAAVDSDREDGPSLPLRATAELNRGVLYRNLGDPRLAIDAFERAGALFDRLGSVSGRASVDLNAGRALCEDLGEPDRGRRRLERAIRSAESNAETSLAIESWFILGQCWLSSGSQPEAFSEAERAFRSALERSRQAASEVGESSAAAGLARIASIRGESEAAQEWFDRALAVIDQQASGLRMDRRSAFLLEHRDVVEAAVASAIAVSPGSSRAFDLLQSFRASALRDRLSTSVGRFEPSRPQQAVMQDALEIELFVAEGRLWAFARAGGELTHFDLGSAAPITGLAREAIRGVRLGEVDEQALTRLSQLILQPVLREVGTAGVPQRLIIAPDDVLWHLPFDLLPIDSPEGRRPLLQSTQVVVVPSLTLGAILSDGALGARNAATWFEGWALSPEIAEQQDVRPLAFVEREIDRAADLFGSASRLMIGAEASETALGRGEPVRIRHFATHTRIDEESGLRSDLVLAADREADGLVSPVAVAGLELPAELTVLAACTTLGNPEDARSPALGTLVSAFLVAGSRAVLATRWEVGDQDAAILLDRFYRHLADGADAATALQLAKLELVADPRWADPRRWAAWVLVGASPAIERGRSLGGVAWWLVAGLAAGLLLVWQWRNSRS